MSGSALSNIFIPSGGATETSHPIVTEYFNRFWILLNYLNNALFFTYNQEVDPPFRE